MRKRLSEITPNHFNGVLFEDSLRPDSIAALARDIEENGLHYPIRVTRVGVVIIDGERRWRACKSLGWDHIEVIEEDVHRDEILDHVIDAVSSQRHMTLFEQARVYRAYYHQLKKGKRAGAMSHIEAKRLAMLRAHFPFSSWSTADQLVQVLERGDADIHQKLIRGDISITAAYERLERRPYNRLPRPDAAPKAEPEPTPADEAVAAEARLAREAERRQRQEELERTRNLVEAKRDVLQSKEAQHQLIQLFEPDPPPPAKKFRDNEETRLIAEAFEALAVREEPEKLVGRLTAFIENIVQGVKQVDEQRARDIVRGVIKPMVLRLAHEFPKRAFDTPDPQS